MWECSLFQVTHRLLKQENSWSEACGYNSGCVTLDTLLNVSGPMFPSVQNRNDDAQPAGLYWR